MAANEELIGFVREALARGLSRPQVEAALRQAGWDAKQVSAALGARTLRADAMPLIVMTALFARWGEL